MRTATPARQGPAFPRWLPIAVIGAVAVVAILLATRGGNDKDVVTAGATTIAINSTASLPSATSSGSATTNSPESVFRTFVDAVIAGRCTEALGLFDAGSRKVFESIRLDLCGLLADDPPTSYRVDGVRMLDPDRARIDNTATLRSGAVDSEPAYAVRESGNWKLSFEFLEADPATRATTGNSPQGVAKAYLDALIAGRCDEAKRYLDTATLAYIEREKANMCTTYPVASYTISGVFVFDADTVYVYATTTLRTGVVDPAPLGMTRENGAWKVHSKNA
jgi:hypothetical protein